MDLDRDQYRRSVGGGFEVGKQSLTSGQAHTITMTEGRFSEGDSRSTLSVWILADVDVHIAPASADVNDFKVKADTYWEIPVGSMASFSVYATANGSLWWFEVYV